ncbi:hypothetical protein CWQ_01770 [Buchnera aphidicola str. TLW03 (Acyrthosiphon pisum)]|nr:hypothetical protein CWO_01740 [Buchnera aphidicola str. LL01 (Acyrthosiphon pisum)]ADP66723.1 hypothetical protein CWQ_01770 [Buchnera aphidicola str. TLW03 (Acyrthosiphon pisum)]
MLAIKISRTKPNIRDIKVIKLTDIKGFRRFIQN